MNPWIDVIYSGSTGKTTVQPRYQYNKGQQLRVHGIDKNANVLMHYAIRGMTKPIVSIPTLEEDAWVSFVPNALFAQSSSIVAFVYITSETAAQTVCEIEIPITKRPMPEGFELTEDEVNDLNRIIAQLREAVENAKQIQKMIEDMRAALNEATAVMNLSVDAQSISPDQNANAELTKTPDGHYNITFGIPRGETGKPGENGGYYTPAVSQSGELSWSASDPNMPQIEQTANIAGPIGPEGKPGRSGVYLGAEEPMDKSINVWIDVSNGPDVENPDDARVSVTLNGKRHNQDAIGNIDLGTLTASDVKARPDNWMPTASEVKARPNSWMPSASDVGARPDNWMPSANDVGAAEINHTHEKLNMIDQDVKRGASPTFETVTADKVIGAVYM